MGAGSGGGGAEETTEFVVGNELEIGVFELASGGVDAFEGGTGGEGDVEEGAEEVAGRLAVAEFEADLAGFLGEVGASELGGEGGAEGVEVTAGAEFELAAGEAGFEFGAGAVEEELPLVEDEQAVADAVDVAENMGTEDDGFAAAELFEEGEGLATADGVEAGGGFVPNEEFGVIHEGCGDPEAGFHAGGVGADAAAGVFDEADGAEEVAEAGMAVAAAESEAAGDELEVTDGGEVLRERGFVGEEPNALAQRFCARVHGVIEDGDFAGGGGEEAEGEAEEGGFAGAVGSEEADGRT